ncbi:MULTISPECIES: hypothetical protein [Paenibacillus]|uniref:hypothetical protein n=1 Tax=Paenibacillus TaxID=44249 RepID=UPI00096D398F|nr:hypothetical protein [Paenibacillus odorifer]OMD70957.1 hypothetical protein BSK50_26630 [Paenibacillus odorifer]
MKSKDVKSALGVIAISSGLLALTALAVPTIVAYTTVNQNVSQANVSYTQELNQKPAVQLASSQIPVLKVATKTPVSTIKSYFERTVTAEEIKQINEYAEKARLTGKDEQLTRQFTDQENKRRMLLDDQYKYDGLRPKQKLPLKSGSSEFYLDQSKFTYVIPKRELTDEEMLQLIDWNYRFNYVVSLNLVVAQPDKKDISQDEALRRAEESVSRLFGVDLSKLQAQTSYYKPFPDSKGQWFVNFLPYRAETLRAQDKSYFMYNTFVDAKSGTVLDTTIVDMSYKRTPITAAMNKQISQDSSWLQAAKSIVVDKQGETRAITSSSIIKDSAYDKSGVVAVLVKLKDGSSYTVELRYPEKTLRCLIYTPVSK